MAIRFRPHHFMCALGFQGKGYSSAFTSNFSAITKRLRDYSGDDTILVVEKHTDDICTPCPNKNGLKCTQQTVIEQLDTAHGLVLGLKNGDRLRWGEAKKRIADSVTPDVFDRICAPCSWKPLGLCLEALEQLKNQQKKESGLNDEQNR